MSWLHNVLVLAMFEVMDKEPSLLSLGVFYGVMCVLAHLASRRRWWGRLLLLPVIAVSNNIAEIRDPYVGPAILREAGHGYVALSYAMMLSAFAFTIIIAIRQRFTQIEHIALSEPRTS